MRHTLRIFFAVYSLFIFFQFLVYGELASAQTINEPVSAMTGSDGGGDFEQPADVANDSSMFFGPITPEQALENADRLQELKLADVNAELPVQVALPPQPQLPPIYSEAQVDGEIKYYVVAPDGSKAYFPPTSAVFYEMLRSPKVIQTIDDQIASIRSSSLKTIAFALVVSPAAASNLLKLTGSSLRAILFPNSTSSFTVPTPSVCSTETCISPTYGNGTTSQKGDLAVLRHAGYDYAASSIKENGKYKMWWCGDGNISPDLIFYAETTSANPDSGWTLYGGGTHVFGPTGDVNDFDGSLTCDPSVIHVGGMYFMYYGGNTFVGSTCSTRPYSYATRIGVAYSYDGISWSRWQPGAHVPPIVSTKVPCLTTTYGVGQPSASYVDGYFYLTFNDDSITVASPPKTFGQYAIRSIDPFFQTGVEELTSGNTWTPIAGTGNMSFNYSWLPNTNGVDWTFSRATKEFLVAINGVSTIHTGLGEVGFNPSTGQGGGRGSASSVRVFDKGLSTQSRSVTHVIAQWVEGPALIHDGSGGALTDASCNNLQIRVMNPGRDWYDLPRDSTSTNPDMNLNNCELAYHRVRSNTSSNLASDVLKYLECGDLNYEGWDLSSGVSSCRSWASSLGPLRVDDYDGDEISDPTVWRPSTQVWWTKRSTNGAGYGVKWGLSGDQPIFGADYDGDRIADPAVKRGSSFLVRPSTGNCPAPMVPLVGTLGCSFSTATWGSTDVPLPGDYDGDGSTDIAARSLSGSIRYIPSSGGVCVTGFTPTTYNSVYGCSSLAGGSGDKPLVADYDGDGKTDRAYHIPSLSRIAVYPSTGFNSSAICSSINMAFVSPNGPCYTNMSASTDVPVTSYFDSDAKTDIMWWTAASGQYFKTWGQSTNGGAPPNFSSPAIYSLQFGVSGDVPLAKQFNSDSLAEPTVYRGSTGYWYVNKTSSTPPPANTWALESGTTNVYKTQWGLSTDKVEGLR